MPRPAAADAPSGSLCCPCGEGFVIQIELNKHTQQCIIYKVSQHAGSTKAGLPMARVLAALQTPAELNQLYGLNPFNGSASDKSVTGFSARSTIAAVRLLFPSSELASGVLTQIFGNYAADTQKAAVVAMEALQHLLGRDSPCHKALLAAAAARLGSRLGCSGDVSLVEADFDAPAVSALRLSPAERHVLVMLRGFVAASARLREQESRRPSNAEIMEAFAFDGVEEFGGMVKSVGGVGGKAAVLPPSVQAKMLALLEPPVVISKSSIRELSEVGALLQRNYVNGISALMSHVGKGSPLHARVLAAAGAPQRIAAAHVEGAVAEMEEEDPLAFTCEQKKILAILIQRIKLFDGLSEADRLASMQKTLVSKWIAVVAHTPRAADEALAARLPPSQDAWRQDHKSVPVNGWLDLGVAPSGLNDEHVDALLEVADLAGEKIGLRVSPLEVPPGLRMSQLEELFSAVVRTHCRCVALPENFLSTDLLDGICFEIQSFDRASIAASKASRTHACASGRILASGRHLPQLLLLRIEESVAGIGGGNHFICGSKCHISSGGGSEVLAIPVHHDSGGNPSWCAREMLNLWLGEEQYKWFLIELREYGIAVKVRAMNRSIFVIGPEIGRLYHTAVSLSCIVATAVFDISVIGERIADYGPEREASIRSLPQLVGTDLDPQYAKAVEATSHWSKLAKDLGTPRSFVPKAYQCLPQTRIAPDPYYYSVRDESDPLHGIGQSLAEMFVAEARRGGVRLHGGSLERRPRILASSVGSETLESLLVTPGWCSRPAAALLLSRLGTTAVATLVDAKSGHKLHLLAPDPSSLALVEYVHYSDRYKGVDKKVFDQLVEKFVALCPTLGEIATRHLLLAPCATICETKTAPRFLADAVVLQRLASPASIDQGPSDGVESLLATAVATAVAGKSQILRLRIIRHPVCESKTQPGGGAARDPPLSQAGRSDLELYVAEATFATVPVALVGPYLRNVAVAKALSDAGRVAAVILVPLLGSIARSTLPSTKSRLAEAVPEVRDWGGFDEMPEDWQQGLPTGGAREKALRELLNNIQEPDAVLIGNSSALGAVFKLVAPGDGGDAGGCPLRPMGERTLTWRRGEPPPPPNALLAAGPSCDAPPPEEFGGADDMAVDAASVSAPEQGRLRGRDESPPPGKRQATAPATAAERCSVQ